MLALVASLAGLLVTADTAAPAATSTPAASAPPLAGLYVPHPDTLKPRLRGSPVQGLGPWFAPKTLKAPWLVRWPATVPVMPQVSQGADAAADAWLQAPAVAALLAAQPAADAVARVDMQRILGLVGRQPLGDTFSQVLRRMGLDSLQAASVRATLGTDHTLRTDVSVTMAPPKRGLADALGPPAPCVPPAAVPPQATQWHAARILPGKVWQVWETVAGGMWALQWSLARAQLDVLEDSVNKRWMEDVLGFAPQTWVAYAVPGAAGKPADVVAVLGIQQGASAAAFVRETLAIVHDLSPSFTVHASTTAGAPTWLVQSGGEREIHLAVVGNTFVLATSAGALAAQLAFHGSAGAALPDTGSSVACGIHDANAVARQLKEMGAANRLPKDALKSLGKTTWWAESADDGWRAHAVSRPR